MTKIIIPSDRAKITADLDQLLKRWLQDVMQEATAIYWLRRAKALEQIDTPWSIEAAEACRNHARLIFGEFGDVDI